MIFFPSCSTCHCQTGKSLHNCKQTLLAKKAEERIFANMLVKTFLRFKCFCVYMILSKQVTSGTFICLCLLCVYAIFCNHSRPEKSVDLMRKMKSYYN